jgi:hypothetical protein
MAERRLPSSFDNALVHRGRARFLTRIAGGCHLAPTRRGIRVPEDVSIASWGCSENVESRWPSATTVDTPDARLGVDAITGRRRRMVRRAGAGGWTHASCWAGLPVLPRNENARPMSWLRGGYNERR